MFPIEPIVKVSQTEYFILVHYHEKDSCPHHMHKFYASTAITCLDHNSIPVLAEIADDFFYIYEEGLREKCSRSDTLNFIGCDGEKYIASMKNNHFYIQKKNEAEVTTGSLTCIPSENELHTSIAYLDWKRQKTITSIAKWIVNASF